MKPDFSRRRVGILDPSGSGQAPLMFQFDFINIIVLVSLAIHAILLWVLYRYGRKTPGGKAYSVAVLAIAGWVFPMILYRSHLFGETLLWARILYIMASFTSTTFFLFAYTFPEKRKIAWWVQALLLLENLGIIFLCLHPRWMIQAIRFMSGREDTILWGPLYPVYVTHISLFFLAGFILLFLKARQAAGLARRQIWTILVGYFIAANLAMTTNLILPWFGYFELNWLGQFFSTIVAIFTTYAILKHNLLDIKIVATEGLVLILNFFLFIQLISSDTAAGLTLNAVVLVAVLIISLLLIKSVKKEIQRREQVTKLAHSLEEANAHLQDLDQQKTDFLSIAAHQLRTPLSIINGYVELIKDGAYGKVGEKVKEILGNMDQSNGHLIKLVDEFLDVTRIEQGRTKFEFIEADINKVITSVIRELDDRAKQKGLKINWTPDRSLKQLSVDEEKIRHVVFNFIDNAIKYSEAGMITVVAEEEVGGVAVRVKDHGVGFEKIDEANFFQKFYRGENVKTTNVTGTGLGLYVCRKFIEAHNGRIWGQSSGLGKGSEFGFWLPRLKK